MTKPPEIAILAGGCFWGVQDLVRKQPGVISTRVGYTGGEVPNATYRNHGNHAEAIEITFDPEQTSFRNLLEFFFQIHDPSTMNRQGNDVGASYRSAIFYTTDEQKAVAEDTIADVDASGHLARQGGHRGHGGRPVLGGRARAPGLPREVPRRVHVPLHPAELEAPAPRRRGDLSRANLSCRLREPVQDELRVLDVEHLDGREAGVGGIPPDRVRPDDRPGSRAAVLHAHGETVQRAERVEEALHLVGRHGERLLGALIDDEHRAVAPRRAIRIVRRMPTGSGTSCSISMAMTRS